MSGGGWSPFLSSSSADLEASDRYLQRELEMLERAVADQGELPRRELGKVVGCKYWGPGRFSRALKVAVREGRVAHPRRGVYGPTG
jgi:hypothetical protein